MTIAVNAQVSVCLRLAQAITRTRTVEEIYAIALDTLEEALGVSRASILLFDADGVMRFKADRGLSAAYRAAVEGHTPWQPETPDPQVIVVPDVTEEPSLARYLPLLHAEGIAGLAFVPLVSERRVIGKFMLYFDSPRVLAAHEIQLADLFGSQVAFAVERWRTEEALEASSRASQQLAAIVQSSGDAIVSKNLDGIITSWNRAAERMFGYAEHEAVGRSITIIIPPERLAEETALLAEIRAGRAVEMETIRRRRDGTALPIAITVSPVRDRQGRIVGASKVARDISARVRAEVERAELHRRLTTLVAASASLLTSPEADSVVATTLSTAQQLLVADGYAIWSNDADGRWHALKSEGISARFAGRVITSDHGTRASVSSMFSGTRAVTDVSGDDLLEEQRQAYEDEGIRSMLVCPMSLGPDRAATLVFYFRESRSFNDIDIESGQTLANLAAAAMRTADLYELLRTERNAADAAGRRAAFLADVTALLSRSLDYGQTLAAMARLAVPELADWCAIDVATADGRVERVAVAHADPAKVARARTVAKRRPPDPATAGGVHEVIRTGKPVLVPTVAPETIAAAARNEEHRQLLSELHLASYMCLPLVSANGTLGAITLVYAESGRHYTERDLAFAQELSARAALAIDNALAYQRVNEASRVKDEFLATLSHELRTPLNAILGYAQMLAGGKLADDRREHALTVLVRNAQALRQIIDDVLDVARITSGKLRLHVQRLDLSEVVADAVATVQPGASAKDVSVELRAAPGLPPISGDRDRLRQVAWNLLSNAVKFTPSRGHVHVSLERDDSSVRLVVRDDGQGIDPAVLPHIFERFRQGDSRFSREHGGLGLGLAIVRELVELHGGTVSASSGGPGTGSTFTVSLPSTAARRQQRRTTARARPATAAARARRVTRRLDGAKILAVDNEPDGLGLLCAALEHAGAAVTPAGSAAEALDALRRERFDAVVADIGMPRMDGLEMMRRVRALLPEPASQVPAAALTAYAGAADRAAALAAGYQLHIAKPVDPAALVAAVAVLVGTTSATWNAGAFAKAPAPKARGTPN